MIGTVSASVAQQPRSVLRHVPPGPAARLPSRPGILLTRGAENTVFYGDSFTRLGLDEQLKDSPQGDMGGVWNQIGGILVGDGERSMRAGAYFTQARATGWYSIGSGAAHSDVYAETTMRLAGSSPSAAAGSPALVELYAKARATLGVFVRFIPGPSQTLQIVSNTGGGETVHASAGIATTLASGIYQGQAHKLALRVEGATAQAYLGTTVGAPALVANAAALGFGGGGGLRMTQASAALQDTSAIKLDDVTWRGIGSSPDIGAREWFRFESFPEPRAIQGNASIFVADRAADFRGVHPKLPAVGSPGASGPARFVVLSGEVDDFVGNDVMDVSIVARESFKYFR